MLAVSMAVTVEQLMSDLLDCQGLMTLSYHGLLRCLEGVLSFCSVGADYGPEPAGV